MAKKVNEGRLGDTLRYAADRLYRGYKIYNNPKTLKEVLQNLGYSISSREMLRPRGGEKYELVILNRLTGGFGHFEGEEDMHIVMREVDNYMQRAGYAAHTTDCDYESFGIEPYEEAFCIDYETDGAVVESINESYEPKRSFYCYDLNQYNDLMNDFKIMFGTNDPATLSKNGIIKVAKKDDCVEVDYQSMDKMYDIDDILHNGPDDDLFDSDPERWKGFVTIYEESEEYTKYIAGARNLKRGFGDKDKRHLEDILIEALYMENQGGTDIYFNGRFRALNSREMLAETLDEVCNRALVELSHDIDDDILSREDSHGERYYADALEDELYVWKVSLKNNEPYYIITNQ